MFCAIARLNWLKNRNIILKTILNYITPKKSANF